VGIDKKEKNTTWSGSGREEGDSQSCFGGGVTELRDKPQMMLGGGWEKIKKGVASLKL